MGDDDKRSLVRGQVPREPFLRARIQVVCGLVEEQQRRVRQERSGERDPHLPTSREIGARSREIGLFEAEPAQDTGDPSLHQIPPLLLEIRLRRFQLYQVCLAGVCVGLLLRFVEFRTRGIHLVHLGFYLLFDGARGAADGRLLQVPDGSLVVHQHSSPDREQFAGHDSEQGRFPGPVLSDDSVAVAWHQLDVDVLHQVRVPDPDEQVLDIDDGAARIAPRDLYSGGVGVGVGVGVDGRRDGRARARPPGAPGASSSSSSSDVGRGRG
mmetsp:Transcript_27603/g.67134  ORF Transcript_27603/g.67134 Transcript_27603/m.67134 type:complete len:268 (-) Transcript_27603:52-855(-)